jgi:hypothetical protein
MILTETYLALLARLEADPVWRQEVEYVRRELAAPPDQRTADFFYRQYVYVVLCSYWREQYARREWERFFKGHNPDAISNLRKRAAIMRGLQEYPQWFQELLRAEDRLEYLETLPMIGPVTSRHLARNIGIDCVKPDRHLVRIAETFGYGPCGNPREAAETCTRMCRDIQRDIGMAERIGTIDLVLWRSCNLGWF